WMITKLPDPLYRERHSHPAADAERRQPAPGAAALELVKERDDNSRTGSTDRMTQRNRAPVDVQPIARNRHVLQDSEHLRGERFVQLDEIEIVDGEAGTLSQFSDGGHRTDAHDPRIDARTRPAENLRARL